MRSRTKVRNSKKSDPLSILPKILRGSLFNLKIKNK
jgi:hypothetical protein